MNEQERVKKARESKMQAEEPVTMFFDPVTKTIRPSNVVSDPDKGLKITQADLDVFAE